MRYASVRPFFILSVLLVAGLAMATAQEAVNSSASTPAFLNSTYLTAMAQPAALPDGPSDRTPQALGATVKPSEKQLAPCPEPAKLFPLRDYTGPGKGMVNPSSKPVVVRGLDGKSCSLSAMEKFNLFARTTINPKTYLTAAYNAGVAQAEDNDPTWGQGAEGYGKRYAAAFTDQVSSNFFKKFAYPALFRQDPRYFRGEGTGGQRFKHAIAHTFVTRSDSGNDMFNFSRWFGATSAVALGNLYHPGHRRGFTPAAERVGISVGTDMGFDVLREFWPELVRKFHLPFREPAR